MTPHQKKLKRAMRVLGSNYCAAKGSTLSYQSQGSKVLDEFKRKREARRITKKPEIVEIKPKEVAR